MKDWNHPIEDLGQKWSTAGRVTKSPVILAIVAFAGGFDGEVGLAL